MQSRCVAWRLFFIMVCRFFFQAEDGIRDHCVTGVQTCALPISGMDIKEGNVTILAIHALEDGGVSDKSELIRILRKRKKDWGEVQTALRLIRESGRSEERRVGKEGSGGVARHEATEGTRRLERE